MRNRIGLVALVAVLAAVLAWGSVTAAQGRQLTLPAARALVQTGDSPGPVTFNHESHVDADRPSCTSCHPKPFSILKAGKAADGRPITHDSMNAGATCGTCHGKTSFGFDDCTMCHRSQ